MRRRISWLVIATTSTVVVSFVVPLCLLVRTIAEDRAMAAADQEARSVAILVAGIADEAALAEVVDGLDRRGAARTGVLTPSGTVLGSGDVSADDPEVQRARAGEAFTVVDDDGGRVLLPVVTGEETVVVRSSVAPEDLRRGVTAAWLGIIGLGVLLLALGAAIANRLGRRISEPLLDVADVAHRLREGDLSARAEVRGTEETVELARALNGLAERTTELLAEERLAVADLSHRLRTPVTALRLDAEAVSDAAVGERLQEHIGVLQRSIDAIVREARRPVRTDLPASADAVATVQERVDHWRALAEDQGRRTDARLAAGPLMVAVARDDLADLVDVLIDNVFAHTAEPAAFAVHLDRLDGSVRLVVEDEGDGPTLPAGERQGSTGLGLDVARRTAASCGGRLTFAPRPGGGTRVEVLLPLLPG
ncbi:MAG: HAMP domain-containing sensor histidine kinase [Nocardioides sp.]